ncbi:uncharacterized protein RHOBADRAFT_46052 [Rhodotorula graminis WP1]|uniref:Uncharacterized protein n=1 Tax=Rhodotorula graminis (strain WP1) TaxID=578459 RepID=A0A0N8PZQ2_RHOGW|nr:uncharacterized protein RHOBADRAFT_46052 [Rhodotorula graminis WP1]KPV72957.1 hypothetical protein RHOBADRAFT_46052 [Rhodotorula graminis WP1]
MAHNGHGSNPYQPGSRQNARRPAPERPDGEPESQRPRQDASSSRPGHSAVTYNSNVDNAYGYDPRGPQAGAGRRASRDDRFLPDNEHSMFDGWRMTFGQDPYHRPEVDGHFDNNGKPLPSDWSNSSRSSIAVSANGGEYGFGGGAAASNGPASRRPSQHGHSRQSSGNGDGDVTMGGQWSTPPSPERNRSARGSVSNPSNAALQRGRGRPSLGYFSANGSQGAPPSDGASRR